jgi:hypothetical protein
MNLFIRPDGSVQCLYDEKIDLARVGTVDIRRASHVEPAPLDAGMWIADLAPVGGPFLGPFPTRSEALHAESSWLDAQMTLGPVTVLSQVLE